MVERVSQFANIRGMDRSRVIFSHRKMIAGSNRVHVLSRIADAGVDYTGRTNHIAHHLIFSQQEAAKAAAAGLNPADILMGFGWLKSWEGNARLLGPEDDVNVSQFVAHGKSSGRAICAQITGNPVHARMLAWEKAAITGVVILPNTAYSLGFMSEVLYECGKASWNKTFTTSLEGTDELSDFDWILSDFTAYSSIASRCSSRQQMDLTNPGSLTVPTEKAVTDARSQTIQQSLADAPTELSNVNLNIAKRGASQTPRHERPKAQADAGLARAEQAYRKPKKNGLLYYGIGAAAAVIALLIILVPKGRSSEDTNNDQARLAEPQKSKVEVNLKGIGVNEDGIANILELGAKEEVMCTNFIMDFHKEIESFSDSETLDDYFANIPKPVGSHTKVTWLAKMVEARKELEVLKDKTRGFSERMEALDKIYSSLGHAYRNGFGPGHENTSKTFDENLTKYLIEDVLGSHDSKKEISDDTVTDLRNMLKKNQPSISIENTFHKKDRDWRFKVLCDHLQQMLDAEHPSMKKICSKLEWHNHIQAEMNCARLVIEFRASDGKREISKAEKLKYAVKDSLILTDNLKKMLLEGGSTKTTGPVAEKPKNPSNNDKLAERMQDIPREQYILVTREELVQETEVHVPLLKELFSDAFKKEKKSTSIQNLDVKMNPSNSKREKVDNLVLVGNKIEDKFFAISMIRSGPDGYENSIRYTQNGIVYIPEKNVNTTISFTYDKWKSTVVVLAEKRSNKPILDLATTFSFEGIKTGGPGEKVVAKCTGDLMALKDKLYGPSGNPLWGDEDLKFAYVTSRGDEKKLVKFDQKLLYRKEVPKKEFLLIENDVKNAKKAFESFKDKDFESRGKGRNDEKLKQEMLKTKEEALEAITYTFAHALLARHYGKLGESVEGDYDRLVDDAKKRKVEFETQVKRVGKDGETEMVDRSEEEIAVELIEELAKKSDGYSALAHFKRKYEIDRELERIPVDNIKNAVKALDDILKGGNNKQLPAEGYKSIDKIIVKYGEYELIHAKK